MSLLVLGCACLHLCELRRFHVKHWVRTRDSSRFSIPMSTALSQVVLPDEKDDKKDLVVFLNAADAADTEEEAQQLGALAALHRVAGDRAWHRILPSNYLPVWEKHGQEVCLFR